MYDLCKIKCKYILHDYFCLFWTLGFPLLFGALVFLTMGLGKMEQESQRIAVVVCGNADRELVYVLKRMTTNEKEPLFLVTRESEQDAEEMLEEEKITGYIINEEDMKVYINDTGNNETILQTVLIRYEQIKKEMQEKKQIYEHTDMEKLYQRMQQPEWYIDKEQEGNAANPIISYIFVAIGQACMFGAYWGIKIVMAVVPGQDMTGKRICCAPGKRYLRFWMDTLCIMLFQMLEITIVITIFKKVFHIDFRMENRILYMAAYEAVINGVLFGQVVALWKKGSQMAKNYTATFVTLLCALFSGLLVPGFKYLAEGRFPILAWINPVSLLHDVYYSMYSEGDFALYCAKTAGLAVMILMNGILVLTGIRRRKNGWI